MLRSRSFHKLFVFSLRSCCLILWLPMYNLKLGHAQQADCKLSDDDAFPVENAAFIQTKSIVAHGSKDGLKVQDVDGLRDQALPKRHFHKYNESAHLQVAAKVASAQSTSELPPFIVGKSMTVAPMGVQKPELTSSQWQVFVYTSILLLLLSVALTKQVCRSKRMPIPMAVLSCMFFGMDNFFIAYAGAYLRVPNAHMAMMFLFIGVIAIVLHASLALYSSTYMAQCLDTFNSTKFMLVCVAFTAFFVDGAEVCSNIGFSINLTESGPLQALASCNVLIVCPFFYYFYGEMLTRLQLCGLALLIVGATFLADVPQWSGNNLSFYGFLWIVFSMILYSSSDITLRVTSVGGLAWQPRVMLMLLFMGLMGFPMYFIDREANAFKEYFETPTLLVWPFLNALAGILGLLSCTIAFEAIDAPCGILSALVNSNSVVLVVLNWAILGYSPSLSKIVGMSFILAGVVLFHLTYSSEGETKTASRASSRASSLESMHESCEHTSKICGS